MKRATKALYDSILMAHGNNKIRAFMCIRNNINNGEFIQAIQDAEDPGL